MRVQIASLIAGAAILAGTPALAQGGAVIVHRGAQAETVRFADGSALTVVRGQPAPSVAEEPAAAPRLAHLAAGETLWLVDGDGARLFACELRQTAQVGARAIHCATRMLPAGLR